MIRPGFIFCDTPMTATERGSSRFLSLTRGRGGANERARREGREQLRRRQARHAVVEDQGAHSSLPSLRSGRVRGEAVASVVTRGVHRRACVDNRVAPVVYWSREPEFSRLGTAHASGIRAHR